MLAGLALNEIGAFDEAEPHLRKSLCHTKKLTPGEFKAFSATEHLGASLLGQGRYDEARPLLMKAMLE